MTFAKLFLATAILAFAANALVFPVKSGSLLRISQNWGGLRSAGKRCHAGIDIYTKSPGAIQAVAAGIVMNTFDFMTCNDGWSGPGMSAALLIYHPSLDKTFNYGEIDKSKIAVKVGENVVEGQFLGRAGHCGMLHLEVYSGKLNANLHWWPPAGKLSENPDKCARFYMSTKPAKLDDPRPWVESLQRGVAPSQSRATNTLDVDHATFRKIASRTRSLIRSIEHRAENRRDHKHTRSVILRR